MLSQFINVLPFLAKCFLNFFYSFPSATCVGKTHFEWYSSISFHFRFHMLLFMEWTTAFSFWNYLQRTLSLHYENPVTLLISSFLLCKTILKRRTLKFPRTNLNVYLRMQWLTEANFGYLLHGFCSSRNFLQFLSLFLHGAWVR